VHLHAGELNDYYLLSNYTSHLPWHIFPATNAHHEGIRSASKVMTSLAEIMVAKLMSTERLACTCLYHLRGPNWQIQLPDI